MPAFDARVSHDAAISVLCPIRTAATIVWPWANARPNRGLRKPRLSYGRNMAVFGDRRDKPDVDSG